eukprot:887015-Rhodomonas_salina.2
MSGRGQVQRVHGVTGIGTWVCRGSRQKRVNHSYELQDGKTSAGKSSWERAKKGRQCVGGSRQVFRLQKHPTCVQA